MNCRMTHLQSMRKSCNSSSSKTVRDSLGWLCWPALPLILLPVSPSPFFACKIGVLWHPHFASYVQYFSECPDPRYCTLWMDVLITMRKLIASTVQMLITLLYINTKDFNFSRPLSPCGYLSHLLRFYKLHEAFSSCVFGQQNVFQSYSLRRYSHDQEEIKCCAHPLVSIGRDQENMNLWPTI
jgi:hypothetical protein